MTPESSAKYSQLFGWAGFLVAALVFLALSWKTALHHFSVGLLIALIVLLVLMAIFEGIWQVAVRTLRKWGFEIES